MEGAKSVFSNSNVKGILTHCLFVDTKVKHCQIFQLKSCQYIQLHVKFTINISYTYKYWGRCMTKWNKSTYDVFHPTNESDGKKKDSK